LKAFDRVDTDENSLGIVDRVLWGLYSCTLYSRSGRKETVLILEARTQGKVGNDD